MPFEIDPKTGKSSFSFTNLLAMLVVLGCMVYFFWLAFGTSKADSKDNTALVQVTTVMIGSLTLVLGFYYGSSSNAVKQAAQITDLQKTATDVALSTSNAALDAKADAKAEIKIDKAQKLDALNKELKDLEPESDRAKELLEQIKDLENKTT